MANEMYIENQAADMSDDFSSLVSYLIDDVKEFGFRNSSRSLTIIMPGSKRNNALFGNIFDIKSSNQYSPASDNINYNFNAAVSARVIIFQNRIQVFKGILKMLEIVEDRGVIEYETAVIGELGGFVAKAGAKKLEELDFSAYNEAYNFTNITNSWSNPGGSGLYYPAIDYGGYSTDKKNWQYKTFRPALYVKEYIDKIFAGIGYTYECALFNTTRFKNLIVPNNRKRLTTYDTYLLDISVAGFSYTPPSSIKVINWSIHNIVQDFTFDVGHQTYTYSGAGPVVGTFDFRLKGSWTKDFSIPFELQFRKNGIIFNSITWESSGAGSMDNTYSFTGSFAPGDTLQVQLTYSGGSSSSWNLQLDTGETRLKFTPGGTTTVDLLLNQTIKINDTLPKGVLQRDFFSDIIKLFNLYVIEDKYISNKLIITPFVDFYSDTTTVIDWSNKIDRSKPIRYKPLSELTSRYYSFKFKSDSDFYNAEYSKRYNEGYGDYTFDSLYELGGESQELKVSFSSTPLVGYAGESKVYSTIFKKSSTAEEQIDSNIRILQAKRITGVPSWNILDGATVLGSRTDYGYAGHLDNPDAPANDINFGVPKELFFALASGALNVNQFNVYYSSYMAEITDKDSKMLIASFSLNEQDINGLDFSRIIYIDGVFYRLNKIIDYNTTKRDECKGELLKIINLIY